MLLDFFLSFVIVGICDRFVIAYIHKHNRDVADEKARWFLLHSAVNLLTLFGSFSDTIQTIIYPDMALTQSNLYGCFLVFALHAYHCVFFTLTASDVFHHMVFAIPIPLFMMYVTPYKCCTTILISLNGIPGMIDYFALYCVRCNYIEKITEKKINVYLTNWCRIPLCSFFCGLIWVHMQVNDLLQFAPMLFLLVFNSCYYGNQVNLNYAEHTCTHKNERIIPFEDFQTDE